MLTASRSRVLSLEEHRNETVSLLSRYVPQGGPHSDNQRRSERRSGVPRSSEKMTFSAHYFRYVPQGGPHSDNQRRSERRSTQEAIVDRAVQPRPGVRTLYEPVNAHYVTLEQFSASDNFEFKEHAVNGSYNSKSGGRTSKSEASLPNGITKTKIISKPENILYPACKANAENPCSKLFVELIKLIYKLKNNEEGLAAEMQCISNVYMEEVDQGWKEGKGQQANGHSTIILNKLRQKILSKLKTSLKNEKKPDDLFCKATEAVRLMESALAGNTNDKIALAGNTNDKIALVNTISAAVAAIATVVSVVGIHIAFPVIALLVTIAAIAFGITFGLRLIRRMKAKREVYK